MKISVNLRDASRVHSWSVTVPLKTSVYFKRCKSRALLKRYRAIEGICVLEEMQVVYILQALRRQTSLPTSMNMYIWTCIKLRKYLVILTSFTWSNEHCITLSYENRITLSSDHCITLSYEHLVRSLFLNLFVTGIWTCNHYIGVDTHGGMYHGLGVGTPSGTYHHRPLRRRSWLR